MYVFVSFLLIMSRTVWSSCNSAGLCHNVGSESLTFRNWTSEIELRAVCVGCVVDKVAVGQFFLCVL